MKGTTFQKPFEFRLEIQGEAWRPGDSVRGTLTVKNHGTAPFALETAPVRLAQGDLKKAHAKSPQAFKILASVAGPASSVAPGQEGSFPWEFATDRNSAVTDNVSSPFVLYGTGDDTTVLGRLQLTFHPTDIVDEFLKALQVQFRFVRKSHRWSKGWLEVKLAPPTAKSFSSLEHVFVSFHFDGDTLEVHYQFNIKKIQPNAVSATVTKEKLEHSQALGQAEYRLPSGRLNPERMESAIREALQLVEA